LPKQRRSKPRKESLLDIKELDIEDWRGILALLVILLFFIALVTAIILRVTDAIQALMGFSSSVVIILKWYFDARAGK